MRKTADRNLAGQLFPTVVHLESAHDRLKRYTMKRVARLVGASSRGDHAYIVPRHIRQLGLGHFDFD